MIGLFGKTCKISSGKPAILLYTKPAFWQYFMGKEIIFAKFSTGRLTQNWAVVNYSLLKGK